MHTKKTILYLRTDLGCKDLIGGGSVAHTVGVIKGFLACNFSIIVASCAIHAILETMHLPKLLKLQMPPWTALLGFKLQSLLSNLFFFMPTHQLCKKIKPTYIYQRYSLLNAMGILLSWWHKIPLILEFNGSEVWVDEHWAKQRRLRLVWLIAWFERINLTYAHTIVVVSQPLRDSLIAQQIDSHKIIVQPNGVDADLFDPAQLSTICSNTRKKLGLENAYVVGFAGTFSYWHGIEQLAEIIPAVITCDATIKFLLIGSGPLLPLLEQLCNKPALKSHIIITGMVNTQQVRNYLSACDLFLLPTQPNKDGSPFFGSPTKLFEYMSLAKPIIASALAPIIAVLETGKNQNSQSYSLPKNISSGILVAPNDITGFVKAICDIRKLPNSEHALLGEQARKKILHAYTWQHHADNILKFVQKQQLMGGKI